MKNIILLLVLLLSPECAWSAWTFSQVSRTYNAHMTNEQTFLDIGACDGYIAIHAPPNQVPDQAGYNYVFRMTDSVTGNYHQLAITAKAYTFYSQTIPCCPSPQERLDDMTCADPCIPPEVRQPDGTCQAPQSCVDWTDIIVDNVETTYPAANACVPRDDYGCLAEPVGSVGIIYIDSAGIKREITDYKYTGVICDPNAPEFNPPEIPLEQPDDEINTPIVSPENPINNSPGQVDSPDIQLSGNNIGMSGSSNTTSVLNGDGTTTTTTNGTISNSGSGQDLTGSGDGYGDSTYEHEEIYNPATQEKTETDSWNSGTSKYEPPSREIDFTGMNEQLERLSSSGPIQLFNSLKNIVSLLSGTPQAPEFTFNVGHHDFNVSLECFDTVASIFRVFMALIVAIGTIYFIFKQWGVTS